MIAVTRRAAASMFFSGGAALALTRQAATAPNPLPPVHTLGQVCQKRAGDPPSCTAMVDVRQVEGRQAVHFVAKLATDADGAPRAYHPCDKHGGDNVGKAFDILGNLNPNDLHGIQGQGGAIGPAPGYHISGTSVFDPTVESKKNTAHWVDASTVPYFVLPSNGFPVPQGTRLSDGCIGFVVDTVNGGSSGAMMADHGRLVGEGSLALVRRLGLAVFSQNRFPKIFGYDEPEHFNRFFYLIFPDVVVAPPWSIKTIQQTADALFMAWGGDDLLRRLFPAMPARKAPDETPLPHFPDPGAC